MDTIQRTLLLALGFLIVVAIVVGAVLRHHIGGFIETVAREAREEEAREEAEAAERARKDTNNKEKTQEREL